MSITSIATSPAPQPRPADNAGNAPSAAASAFGAMVDDKAPRSSSSSSSAPQKPRSGAGKTSAPRAQQRQQDDTRTASAASSRKQPRQQDAGKAADLPGDKTATAVEPKPAAASPVPELPEEAASAAVDPAPADPVVAVTLDPATPAPTDAPADTVPGALGGDAVKADHPAQPVDPAALVTQAVAADAVADQLATTDAPIIAPKPAAPVKKPAVAATDKPAAKPAPVQAADASSLPTAPMVAPKLAEAASVSANAPADAATPDPFDVAARAASKAVATATTARTDDTAAREAGSDVSGRQQLPPGGLSSALLTQSLPADTKLASFGTVYAANLAQTSTDTAHATVSAQAGRIGRDMGVEIARSVAAGRDEITIRLDPPEMGRVEVRMSFDREGSLRAVVAADNHGALNLLKRDAGDLIRSLSDAGVRSDSQSFRFDTRGGDAGQQWRERSQDGSGGRGAGSLAGASDEEPIYRPLRASGRIDMMA